MAEHNVDLRPYEAVDPRGFAFTIPYQRQIIVDGRFVGYCPTERQPIPIVGRVPGEVRKAIEIAAETFWNDGDGPGEIREAPVLEKQQEFDDE